MEEPNEEEHNGYGKWQGHLRTHPEHSEEIFKLVDECDVSVWQILASEESLAVFRMCKDYFPEKPFITEIDDWVGGVPCYNPAFNGYTPGSRNVQLVMNQLEHSDAVITSTKYLGKLINEKVPGLQTACMPNSIDFDLWGEPYTPPQKRKEVHIGWIGGANHEDDLALIERPVKRVLKRNPHVTFHVIQGVPAFFKNCPQIEYQLKFWPMTNNARRKNVVLYPDAIKGFKWDIGIAPLVDNDFNRAKSNLRYLEYTAAGLPVVASDVVPFKQTVEHMRTGLLAKTEKDWEECLELLIKDRPLRKRVRETGWRHIRSRYDILSVSENYFDFLTKVLIKYRGDGSLMSGHRNQHS